MAERNDSIEKNEDMGLGAKVIQENRSRFINEDGTFNVHRKGMFERGAFSPYHAVLNMSWPRFYAYILGVYALANAAFSALYLLGGAHAFPPIAQATAPERFRELFFYSIQVITTLGSSALQPATIFTKTIFALEAVTGMLGFAVGAGLIFARLSNPSVRIVFSKQAIIAPFNGGRAFMFRIINGRSNELIEVSVGLTIATIGKDGKRSFRQVPLERNLLTVFPLHWTVVHPILQESPIYAMSGEELASAHTEFLIGVTATDQDLAKKVYARHSYLFSDIVIGAKFKDIIEQTDDGTVVVDPARIHEIETAELPRIARIGNEAENC